MIDDVSRRAFLATGGALATGTILADPLLAFAAVPPEDGYELWLRYRLVENSTLLAEYRRFLTHLVAPNDSAVRASTVAELRGGLRAMLGTDVPHRPGPERDGAVVVGTPASSPTIAGLVNADDLAAVGQEGYLLGRGDVDGWQVVYVGANTDRGALYGAFHLLRLLQTRQRIDRLDAVERPANPLRLANHWDNLDRTVERGYAGQSIFHWDELPQTRPRYTDYARALASLGMNGTVVNNVNASATFLSSEMIANLTGLAEVLRAWGIRLYLSANFASPMVLDGLPTADPLDSAVREWWSAKATEIYTAIPDFGGFLVKANSEGQPGPVDYDRTHADGANVIAEGVAPHGGIVMWRAFIHDFNANNWAHMAYETIQPLDGQFADNVVLQMKNGPIDFQVREPLHPLFGALPRTNSMLELQVTQEYTGQSLHLCYLVPQWKEIYEFDTHAEGTGTTIASIIDGSTYGYSNCGVAGVMNFGSELNWTGHHLAAANTHGYGRLAWNPGLGAADLATEWTTMTFGSNPTVINLITSMLLSSRRTYEDYTSPLGCGFMSSGRNHLDPDPRVSQSFHRSDADGTGFDRTIATGDGYTGLYYPPVTDLYETLENCPDELLMFFHRVPYAHQLHSGKSVIEHIYDTHFDGVNGVEEYRRQWRRLRTLVDARRFAEVLGRLDAQVEHAELWRDVMVGYFFETATILDEKRSWVQARFVPSAVVGVGGEPSQVELNLGNASDASVEVTAQLRPVSGWETGVGAITLAPREFGSVAMPVVPPTQTVALARLYAEVDAGAVQLLDGPATKTGVDVVITPPAADCVLAFDAGSAQSPLLAGYTRLSPADAFDAERGYGWVGGAPQSRDRGSGLDVLRRDFVNDTTARVLRITVPAGEHTVYLLIGDQHTSYPTYVHSGGELLASSELLFGGDFVWIDFTLSGGARTVDLELSSVPDQHWHLDALVIPAQPA